MTEEKLLFICQQNKTCKNEVTCTHKLPHKYISDSNGGNCAVPTCGGRPSMCKPFNINKKTKKQFAKFVLRRLLPFYTDYD